MLALAACESDAPKPRESAEEARSAAVRQAGTVAAAQIDGMLDSTTRQMPALRLVATSTSDSCRAGETQGTFPHDTYRLRCARTETRYFGAGGDLRELLRMVDRGTTTVGLIKVSGETLENLEARYGADYEELLVLLGMTFGRPGYDGQVHIRYSQVSGRRTNYPPVELRWPVVYHDDHPVDLDALWSGPLRGHRYLVTVSSTTTYHEVPWPS
ncbi:hypothetical protein V6V47_01245 [Micromonospora sp. CPCC 205539]